MSLFYNPETLPSVGSRISANTSRKRYSGRTEIKKLKSLVKARMFPVPQVEASMYRTIEFKKHHSATLRN